MKDIKNWNRVNNASFKLSGEFVDRGFVYCDHPYRENTNAIDQLIMRAK
jgi:hypothetical protein